MSVLHLDRGVLLETSRALPLVHLGLSTRVGAALDPVGQDGTTRLTSSLLRRTAGGRAAAENDTLIDTLGASLSADVTASTVSIHGTVLTRSLDAYIDFLVDALARPSLAEDELGRVRRETEAELIEALDNDRALAGRWFRRTFFAGHPYGRGVSGTASTLPRIDRAAVQGCHRRLLVRDGIWLALAGDLDEARATAVATRLRDALPAAAPAADATPDPVQRPGRHLVIVDKPERTQTQILIGTTGTHPQDDDHVALHVANTVFGGTFTGRLTREVRSKRGWSYGAYSSLPVDRRRQAFSMWTFPKAEDAGPCVALQLELLEQWARQGITAEELGWAQSYLTRSHAFAIDTAPKRVGLALDELVYDLPAGYHRDYLQHVGAVTLEQANAAAARRIDPAHLLVVVVGTASLITEPLKAAIPGLASIEIVPFDRE